MDKNSGISELRKVWRHRLDDARALLNAVRWRGSMYIGGYAIECLLKTKLMQKFQCRNLQELDEELLSRNILPAYGTVFMHHLEGLLRLTGRLDILKKNPPLWSEFTVANKWIPAWRYKAELSSRNDAEEFLGAVEKICGWIDNNI